MKGPAVKEPRPEPPDAVLLLVVGFGAELIATPLAVTLAPPSAVTSPPLVKLFFVMFVQEGLVVTVGRTAALTVTVAVAVLLLPPALAQTREYEYVFTVVKIP